MDKLLERYVTDADKIATINGLLIAQALCARKTIEGYNPPLLDVMDGIVKAIEQIKAR